MDTEISEPTPSQLKVLAHHQYHTPDAISPTTVDPCPLTQFHAWFLDAVSSSVREPEAMTLSTVDVRTCTPSCRVVLFKQLDERGFVFYTNYASRKSRELDSGGGGGRAALCFYWREMHRQVRVVGVCERVERGVSEGYWGSRPVGSRVGAWASRQSEVVGEGEVERRVRDVRVRFGVGEGEGDESKGDGEEVGDVPIPEFWGGWRVVPEEVEFWCGKPSRLHDRVRYLRDGEGWKIERLSP